MNIRAFLSALAIFVSVPAFAIDTNDLADFVNQTCQDTVVVSQTQYGKVYDLLTPRFDATSSRAVSLVESPDDKKLKLRVRNPNGKVETYFLPKMNARGMLAIKNSVWILTRDRLVEFSLTKKQIVGRYPTFPKPFEMHRTTEARGFTYNEKQNSLYIAHGELGISVFDLSRRTPIQVLKTGMQDGSMAAAIAFWDKTPFVLQGAYHPNGFNGLSIHIYPGEAMIVKYPLSSGVVDPYKSTLTLADRRVFINNGGWIHTYDFKALEKKPKELAPTWIPVEEMVPTAGGVIRKYLMVNGDLLVSGRNLLACSSVHYVPVGENRPIREARMIRLSY